MTSIARMIPRIMYTKLTGAASEKRKSQHKVSFFYFTVERLQG